MAFLGNCGFREKVDIFDSLENLDSPDNLDNPNNPGKS